MNIGHLPPSFNQRYYVLLVVTSLRLLCNDREVAPREDLDGEGAIHQDSLLAHLLATLTINILFLQTLLELNDFLYRDCDEHALPWTFRWSNIKKELEHFYVDVSKFCLT